MLRFLVWPGLIALCVAVDRMLITPAIIQVFGVRRDTTHVSLLDGYVRATGTAANPDPMDLGRVIRVYHPVTGRLVRLHITSASSDGAWEATELARPPRSRRHLP